MKLIRMQFRNREHELEELYKSFTEVRQKFAQLESAFEINLKCQQKRENEFNLQKFKSQDVPDKSEKKNFKAINEFESRLISLSAEKDKWKRAFQQQKDSYEMCKRDHEKYVKSIKRECEDILIATRKSAEKHFNEIVKIYDEAREKSNILQNQLEKCRKDFQGNISRTLELANLLETLQKFDINVDVICRNTAEALKSLHKSENVYAEKLRNLRQLTWTFNKKSETDAEHNLLRLQNSVLRDIVKDLKRKLELANTRGAAENKLPERDTRDSEDLISTKSICCQDNVPDKSCNYEFGHSCKQIESAKNSNQEDDGGCSCDQRRIKSNKYTIDRPEICYGNAMKTRSECDSPKEFNGKSNALHVETFETHFNGVRLLEHVLRLATTQEIKLKYSPVLINEHAPMKVEFLDDDNEYFDGAPMENTIYVYLRHLERIVRMKNNGVNCGVQTRKTKFQHNSTQTTVTAMYAPARLNVGSTMLNSEKRAIERSLGNLERTVADLKFNSVDKARSLMEKDAKLLKNDEFYEYIRLLAR